VAELDEEQDVQTLEQDGVDVEEVRGHDSRRLGT
jgi:biotin operon repressor